MALIEAGEYVVVLEEGADLRVLACAEHLDVAAAAYMAALSRYPKENVDLRYRTRVVKRHEGAPKPESVIDPALPDWDVRIIRGSRMDFRGTVMAADEVAAKDRAIEHFSLNGEEVKRLVVKSAVIGAGPPNRPTSNRNFGDRRRSYLIRPLLQEYLSPLRRQRVGNVARRRSLCDR